MTIARYILARDIEAFRSQGWCARLFRGHHGANGFALATIEVFW